MTGETALKPGVLQDHDENITLCLSLPWACRGTVSDLFYSNRRYKKIWSISALSELKQLRNLLSYFEFIKIQWFLTIFSRQENGHVLADPEISTLLLFWLVENWPYSIFHEYFLASSMWEERQWGQSVKPEFSE